MELRDSRLGFQINRKSFSSFSMRRMLYWCAPSLVQLISESLLEFMFVSMSMLYNDYHWWQNQRLLIRAKLTFCRRDCPWSKIINDCKLLSHSKIPGISEVITRGISDIIPIIRIIGRRVKIFSLAYALKTDFGLRGCSGAMIKAAGQSGRLTLR